MIRINLVPQDEVRRQAARQRDRQVVLGIAGLLVALVGTAEFVTRRSASEVQREVDLQKTQLAELSRQYQEAVLLQRKKKALESKLETIEILERQRRGPVHVLEHLGGATPEKLWLTEMREAGGAAIFSGRGLDNQTVALFMRNLEHSPYFANVELVETKQVEEGKAKYKEFAIRSTVIYAGRASGDDAGEGPAAEDEDGKTAARPGGTETSS